MIAIPEFEFTLFTPDTLLEASFEFADNVEKAHELPEPAAVAAVKALVQEATILEVAMLQITANMQGADFSKWLNSDSDSDSGQDPQFELIEVHLRKTAKYMNLLQAIGIDVKHTKASSFKDARLNELLETLSRTVVEIQKVLFSEKKSTPPEKDPWED